MSGSFSSALSPNDNSGGKVLILNGTFTQSYSTASVQEFKEDSVYKWNDINWEINIKHENNNPPIIKAILEMDNSMVFGMVVYLDLTKRIKWNSDLSTLIQVLLNTVWKKVLLTLYIVKRRVM
jgi:hypothetical protein